MFDSFIRKNWFKLNQTTRDNFLKTLLKIAFADDADDDAKAMRRYIFDFAFEVKSEKVLTAIARHKNTQRWMLNRVLSCDDYEIQSIFVKYCKQMTDEELYSIATKMVEADIMIFKLTFFYRHDARTLKQRKIILDVVKKHISKDKIEKDSSIAMFVLQTQLRINSTAKRLKEGCLVRVIKNLYCWDGNDQYHKLKKGEVGLYLGSEVVLTKSRGAVPPFLIYKVMFNDQVWQIYSNHRLSFKVL